jgi:hypothetical protein
MTGVAANIISGSTIDSLCQLEWIQDSSPGTAASAEATINHLPAPDIAPTKTTRWTHCQFLILDEVPSCIYTSSNIVLGLHAGCCQAPANLTEALSI